MNSKWIIPAVAIVALGGFGHAVISSHRDLAATEERCEREFKEAEEAQRQAWAAINYAAFVERLDRENAARKRKLENDRIDRELKAELERSRADLREAQLGLKEAQERAMKR